MAHEEFDDGESAEGQRLPELKLDARQAQGLLAFYRKLPEDPQVIRFFDRKDFYTVHGDNALFIARQYYKTMTAVRYLGTAPDTLPGVSLSRGMFETVLRDLLVERTDHTVEMYEGSGGSWRLVKTATPGRVGSFEDVLFANNEMAEAPVVMAVHPTVNETERHVGMAFVDLSNRVIGTTHFLDDDQYTNLESAMVALGCKECVLPQDGSKSPDGRRLRDVMVRCNVLVTERKRSEFKARDVEQDLRRLVKEQQAEQALIADAGAAAAVAALLKYTELLAEDFNHGKFSLQPYSLDTYMRLDAAALRALNVLESKTDSNKNFSLVGLMNRTCTAGMGRRLLSKWLKQPLLDVEEIKRRHDAVEAFVNDAELRQNLRQHLKRIPDIERLVRKVERRKANLQDVVKLYQASMRLPFICTCVEQAQGTLAEYLQERYAASLKEWTGPEHLGKYDGLVEAAVDLDGIEAGEYNIAAGYDPSLGDIKAERDQVESQIRRVFRQAADDLDLPMEKSLKLDKSPQMAFVFRITKKDEPSVRKKINSPPYVMLETRKDGVKFTNGTLRRLSEQYLKLTEEYAATQRELVNKVVEVAATFVEVFEGVAARLTDMDVLLSFADLSVSAPVPYVRPIITPSNQGDIILMGSRHPCVEVQEDVEFIPNDCRLVRGSSWFQLITGPNMGGKSTFIRQVGVNVLMAQAGCFVPCDSAEVSVRDCIFARVGAGDCQLRGMSTFMSEMLETAAILKSATAKSLIIIDELGRGTSTYDGFGLAWAICEHLITVTRAPTLFATHFHELTALANEALPPAAGMAPVGVANFHVSAHIDEDSRKVTMLYKMEEGPCDQSFGIHVAEFAHFPTEVVEVARKKAAELEDFTPPAAENTEVGAKRKRVPGPGDAASVASHVKKFLHDFAALPLNKMEPDEALRKVAEQKAALDREIGTPWLEQLQ